jgi:predicted HTH domain antitoxin
LTEEGKFVANDLMKNTRKREIQRIEEFNELLNDLSKDEILAFIYFSYPLIEIEKESIEYKDILPKRIRIALSLYKKGKISAQKAAQIAGEDLQDLIVSLRE